MKNVFIKIKVKMEESAERPDENVHIRFDPGALGVGNDL